jgi:hypothetical protein
MGKTILVLSLGLLIGGFVVGAAAKEEVWETLGAFLSHRTEQRVDISVGVTRSGEPRRANRLLQMRDSILVPQHFGSVVTIYHVEERTVIWFKDGKGVLRNVVIPRADNKIFSIEPSPSTLVETVRRPL